MAADRGRGVPPSDRLTRALGQLPAPTAPHTLLPRVMAAVQAWAMRPWYERAWFTWPVGWQVATMACLLTLVAVIWRELPPLTVVSDASSTAVSSVAADGQAGLDAVRLATRVLSGALQPILLYAFAIVAVMTAACLAGAFAINRAVFGRT